MSEELLVPGVILGPWIAVLWSAIAVRWGVGAYRVATIASVTTIAGFVISVVASISSLTTGIVRVGLGSTTLRLDAAALVLSMLALGLSGLIQWFAIRYLRGDDRQAWFVIFANMLTGFTVLLVCAGSIAIFAVAWLGAGAALVLLLATYWRFGQSREGVRAAATRFIVADASFLLGVLLLLLAAGRDLPLDRLGQVASSLPMVTQVVVSLLVVVAALARSTQIPFQGWLPFTLGAPTPVSALMHAGAVNAGAILLIRFAPLVAPHQLVMTVIFLAGTATLVHASAVRLVRADVKGRLVFSTMAQMGFMIMVCGLGLFAAAIFHLVAHSLFKSALFLGAGAGVREHGIQRDLPRRPVRARPAIIAIVSLSAMVPLAALTNAELVIHPTISAARLGLLIFVAVTAGVALGSALVTNFTVRTAALGLIATLGLSFAYIASLTFFTAPLELAIGIEGAPAWLLILPTVGLLLIQLASRNPAWLAQVSDHVYVYSLASTVRRLRATPGVPA